MQTTALLLNASLEPIRIIPLKRAVLLVLREKAVIEASDTTLNTVSNAFASPLVVRLLRYVKLPYRKTVPLNRENLTKRDKGRCAYCDKAGNTIDHVLPRSRGGRHEWSNVVLACYSCNNKKASKLLSELGWKLSVTPTAPKATGWLLVGVAERNPAWEPYLAPYQNSGLAFA